MCNNDVHKALFVFVGLFDCCAVQSLTHIFRDHVFIEGTTDPKAKPYRNAEGPEEVAAWKKNHRVCTFHECVKDELNKTKAEEWKLKKWEDANSAFP